MTGPAAGEWTRFLQWPPADDFPAWSRVAASPWRRSSSSLSGGPLVHCCSPARLHPWRSLRPYLSSEPVGRLDASGRQEALRPAPRPNIRKILTQHLEQYRSLLAIRRSFLLPQISRCHGTDGLKYLQSTSP
eukprot:GHVT01052653.1.p1 GENE.GHVT01052653.1~~GHVT01052653.1.p1  ORF type:complete len:132 (-),score=25.97 GHVT01052653.1:21-416(-)